MIMEEQSPIDNKLIPVLTHAVDVVKMALYKKVKDHVLKSEGTGGEDVAAPLAGAVVNDVFCTPNLEPDHIAFVRENRGVIAAVVRSIPLEDDLKDMVPHISDALRVSFMCDHHNGVDTSYVLTKASQLGILEEERTIPLPRFFIESVRELGGALGLVIPPVIEEESEEQF